MPVANLQAYRTVGLRVQSTAFAAQGLGVYLETAVLDKLRQRCGFEQVARAGGAPADVLLDLNITNTARGGGGWVSNNNVATLDTLLVLSDGQNGELLGTARIRGKSSGAIALNELSRSRGTSGSAFSLIVSDADVCMMNTCSSPALIPASSGSAATTSRVMR